MGLVLAVATASYQSNRKKDPPRLPSSSFFLPLTSRKQFVHLFFRHAVKSQRRRPLLSLLLHPRVFTFFVTSVRLFQDFYRPERRVEPPLLLTSRSSPLQSLTGWSYTQPLPTFH